MPSQQRAPRVYQEFRDAWAAPERRAAAIRAFTSGEQSFIPHLLPEQALELSAAETLDILRQRYGAVIDQALAQANSDTTTPASALTAPLRGPYAAQPDAAWLRRTHMVGINVRTVGTFWNIVKYALTLPAAQDAIHLLPIWQPGVVGSLYGMSSWQLNQEFYSAELAAHCPWLDTVERQLRAIVNTLHATGRTVGMDVIPHTDRFSEMVLSYPEHFEWLQRQDTVLVSYAASLHEQVQAAITNFLVQHGPAISADTLPNDLFTEQVGEAERLRLLFGLPTDEAGRAERRNQVIAHLVRYGYEPAPATMAPPFRGLQVDTRPAAKSVDGNGAVWREYSMIAPTPMSRVFGPLARYNLYEPLEHGDGWQLDFSRPRMATWRYVCEHYGAVQQAYGFDFMRGDMAHVQMRPEGIPEHIDSYYDLLGAVKQYVRNHGAAHFGYFAETFLGPRDVFGYGEEIDHLEAASAESTLGDLQSTVLGSTQFLQRFRYYDDLRTTRLCTPAFTVMTADKDDPRFDEFYRTGNAARLFIALLLRGTPAYTGLGFETRDIHLEPAPNEHYTKLFVFHETSGPKATNGSYVWGKNGPLYYTITRLKTLADALWPDLAKASAHWLIAPDATGENPIIAWLLEGGAQRYVCAVNTSAARSFQRIGLPLPGGLALQPIFSTEEAYDQTALHFNGRQWILPQLRPGEGVVIQI